MRRRRIFALAPSLALLGALPGSASNYRAAIAWSGFGMVHSTLPVLVTLASGGRMSPFAAGLQISIEPQPVQMPPITWSVLDARRVHLRATGSHLLRLPNDSAYIPPASNAFSVAIPGEENGLSEVVASIGPPINQRITLPAYTYRSVNVGCAIGFSAGVSFDERGIAHRASSTGTSDLYVTGPANDPAVTGLFAGCPPAFAGGTGPAYTLHVPGGGAFVPDPYLPHVTVHEWRNAFVQTSSSDPAQETLIFKMRDGRIGKAMATGSLVNGGYLIETRREFDDVGALRGKRQTAVSFGRSVSSQITRFSARITFWDPPATTTGPVNELFTMLPLRERTPFIPLQSTARVALEPPPYSDAAVTWSGAGKNYPGYTLGRPFHLPPAARPGRFILTASIAAPVFKTVAIPLLTYDSLVLGCGVRSQGIRFSARGTANPAVSPVDSDLYISSQPDRFDCASDPVLYFPGGGIFLTNGSDRSHKIATGGYPGVQFPDLQPSAWRNTRTHVTLDAWRVLAEPCSVPESQGIAKMEFACATLPAKTLLFHTRNGRAVKLLLVYSNGTTIVGGPFAVEDASGSLL